jgi:hypothetical protein
MAGRILDLRAGRGGGEIPLSKE